MKSELRFHGVNAAQIRNAARDFLAAHPELDGRGLRGIVSALYATDWFDLRSAGIALLERSPHLLSREDLPWLIGLSRRSANWAHVDWIATRVIGSLSPDRRTLRAWGEDEDFWVRRTALLAQLVVLREAGGDFRLFAELAAPMLGEKEFFIRKAIGWVLREVSKKRPALTYAFLRAHRQRVSGLTLREGAKYLSDARRRSLGL